MVLTSSGFNALVHDDIYRSADYDASNEADGCKHYLPLHRIIIIVVVIIICLANTQIHLVRDWLIVVGIIAQDIDGSNKAEIRVTDRKCILAQGDSLSTRHILEHDIKVKLVRI